MSGFKEMLFICDESDTASSIHCYDLQLGARVMMYKGGNGVAGGSLNVLGEDYLITAEASKPFLHVWCLNREEQIKRIGVPGKVTALAVSENCVYCAAGIDNKIYLWNIASGQLLNVVGYHHESITKIVFWNTSYFISAGADGLVAVWRMVDVVTKETGGAYGSSSSSGCLVPFFSSSRHSLPVTDIFLTPGGNTCRLFTVSADQTCQVFSLGPDSGKFLITLNYDFVLTSVLCDRLQRKLFVGTVCGKIILFPMEPCPDANARYVDDGNSFVGHTEAVRALSLSQEDTILASGSNDKKVILWNVSTKQQIGTYQMHGSISDIYFHVVKSDFLLRRSAPRTIISNFERTIVSDPENIEIRVNVERDLINDDEVSYLEDLFLYPCSSSKRNLVSRKDLFDFEGEDHDGLMNGSSTIVGDCDGEMESDLEELEGSLKNGSSSSSDNIDLVRVKREVRKLRLLNRRLKSVNRRLYKFGLEQIWQNRNNREDHVSASSLNHSGSN